MAAHELAEVKDVIQALINEDELFCLRERRDKRRKTFVRPVQIVFGDRPDDVQSGFSRDISEAGIGLIHRFQVEVGDHARVTVSRLWDGPVTFKCRACWCASRSTGWFQSGWQILTVESNPDL